uniref:PH domain-containing protein n=1 Tax=Hyaloperonospora arabidopsidis (strain Emoy2) TaxID=559515 RepID=M4BXL4_HYAAE
MGLKKWLSLSTSQAPERPVKGDTTGVSTFAPSQCQSKSQQRQQQETHRRHTTWEAQQGQRQTSSHPSTRSSIVPHSRSDNSTPTGFWEREHRVSRTSMHVPNHDNDTMCSMKTALESPIAEQLLEENSDVSIGADDDDDRDGLSMANVVSVAQSTRSWKKVLSQATKLDVGLKTVKTRVGEDGAVGWKGTKARCNEVSLQPREKEKTGVVMQGWLEKCGQQFKTWKWRFFVLRKDGVLAYYTDETLRKMKGAIDVSCGSDADVSVQSNSMDKASVFLIATSQRHLMISAPSQPMMKKWIARLHAAGAVPTDSWDPLNKTVKVYVHDTKINHEWKHCDDPTSHIHMEGLLLKRGHVNKNWRNRFFRIEKGELRYYTENQSVLKGSVPLNDTIVSPGMAQCPDGRTYYFVLTSKDGTFEMHLNARDENSMHLWIEALQEAQTALGRMEGTRDTVAGLSLVLKRAEEIPLGKISVLFRRPEDITIEMQKRTEALIVASSPDNYAVAVGCQLISIEGHSVLRSTYAEARKSLRSSSFPLQLEFLLPPFKRGVLIKKSRSGFENWKKRVVIVANGEIRYYKQVLSESDSKKGPAELKHRKSFSLYGCYMNLVQMPGREMCIVVARSPSDKLVLETRSEEERMDWASVIYCSIRMVSQGITSGLIENLQLEKPRRSSKRATDVKGKFEDRAQHKF